MASPSSFKAMSPRYEGKPSCCSCHGFVVSSDCCDGVDDLSGAWRQVGDAEAKGQFVGRVHGDLLDEGFDQGLIWFVMPRSMMMRMSSATWARVEWGGS
jgi:hypothetical protein